MSFPSTGSCEDIYADARETFEAVLYCSAFAWLLLTASFLPKNEAHREEKCFIKCLRSVTFCFEPCRPLLDKDDAQVVEAARNVGPRASVGYILFFLLLQAVPFLGMVVGIASYYPECGCSNPQYCACTLKINGIPVGSCIGFAIFVVTVSSLASLAFVYKAVRSLSVVRNAASYAVVGVTEQELV